MEKDKLEKAAKNNADDICESTREYWFDDDGGYTDRELEYDDLVKSFIAGAEWLLAQPLVERMTEEEKEKIKELNSLIESMFDMIPEGHVNQRRIVIAEDMLIRIFGKEMFKR